MKNLLQVLCLKTKKQLYYLKLNLTKTSSRTTSADERYKTGENGRPIE